MEIHIILFYITFSYFFSLRHFGFYTDLKKKREKEGVPWCFSGLRIQLVTAVARVAAVGWVQSLAQGNSACLRQCPQKSA